MHAQARIIDANLNRAREGLRVLDDIARFALSRADLTGMSKALRHDLASIPGLCGLPDGLTLATRDTPGDVGTHLTASDEYQRADLFATVRANAGRAAEALRSIEEAAKLVSSPQAAVRAEQLRYRLYDLEKQLALALGSGRRRQWRLCVLITQSLCRLPWQDVAAAAIEAGADCLQLREKSLDCAELLTRAQVLVALARPRGVSVIINDRADIAALADADGVHLGQSDLHVHEARKIVGRAIIGVSTENIAQARSALADGADYCGVGPMFATSTKSKPRLAGPSYLREYLADPTLASLPHLAIGGIEPSNIGELARAGVRGVAVSSCVCSAENPEEVCRRLVSVHG